MKTFLVTLTTCIFLISCNSNKAVPLQLTGVNYKWLDSIKHAADTTYTKNYGTAKFAVAQYFINKKDSIICQVMKDTADTTRQIIITQHNRRTFFAEYYANGQLMAQLPLDSFGQYDGPSKYYYQNGLTETEGNYRSGLKTGQWKNCNEAGKLISTSEYDANGQVIKTTSEK